MRDAALALEPSDPTVAFMALQLLTPIVGGGTPTSDQSNWDGEVPFVTPPDLNGLDGSLVESWGRTLTADGVLGSAVIDRGVLLSCRAPIGHVGTVASPVAFNQGCKGMPVRDSLDAKFLAYCLVAGREALSALGNGTTFMELSARSLGGFKVPWPPRDMREAVVGYLDGEIAEIDAMDAELDRLVETLRERASVLQTSSTFGLGTGQQLESESDSLLFGIPSTWATTKFGLDFIESTERNGDSPLGPLLSISEYRGVELNERTDGQQASEDVSKYRVVHPGQLAANMMWLNHGGLGVSSLTGYISPDYKAFWISERFDSRYVHYLFRSSRYVDYFDAIGTGVRPNAKRVTKTVLGMTPVPMPPLDEQKRLAAELDEQIGRIDDMIADAQRLKALLAERRSTLITEVVTGQKEVGA